MTQLSPELVTFNQGDARPKRHESYLDSSPAPLTEAEEELTNVERGYDATPVNTPERKEKTQEELLEQAVQIELATFDGWMHFRVKNELIKQMYEALDETSSDVKKEKVQAIIEGEVDAERERYEQYAHRMREQQRGVTARLASETDNGILKNLTKDFKFLGSRKKTYFEVARRLEAVQSTGDDGYKDLTEKYIDQVSPEADKEMIKILATQKKGLESKMASLVNSLQERDLALLDSSLDDTVSTLDIMTDPYKAYM